MHFLMRLAEIAATLEDELPDEADALDRAINNLAKDLPAKDDTQALSTETAPEPGVEAPAPGLEGMAPAVAPNEPPFNQGTIQSPAASPPAETEPAETTVDNKEDAAQTGADMPSQSPEKQAPEPREGLDLSSIDGEIQGLANSVAAEMIKDGWAMEDILLTPEGQRAFESNMARKIQDNALY